jgi:acid phosphatase
MPSLISDSDMIYLRATPLPRALESVQQAFWGLYPPSARTADFPPPTILIRTPADETLYPNDSSCRRFAQLSRAFAQRTADHWNDSPEMAYLQRKIGRWMPASNPAVKVDSKPRLSGVMDTINATLAHGLETRLPKEFYDPKALAIIDKIGVEEWYSGYVESREYRMLGIGALMGDIVSRLVASAEHSPADGIAEVGGEDGSLGRGRGGEKRICMALSGCHDTTLAGILSSLGAFEGEVWPHFTSHLAVELFRRRQMNAVPTPVPANFPGEETSSGPLRANKPSTRSDANGKGWSLWTAIFGKAKETIAPSAQADDIGRKPLDTLTPSEKAKLDNYYVRLRYNDRVVTVPGCRAPGKHLEGDESFCTLEAFKSIVDKYTPKNWKGACMENLGQGAFPETDETAGY